MRDFCSMTVRAHHCRTVSSSVHWKFVPYHILALVPRQVCPFFLRSIANALMLYLNSKSGIRDNGKQLVELQQAKETINGGSQMDLIELTMCQPSFSQTCKTSSENHLVLFLTLFLSISKVWCLQDEQAIE